MITVFILMLAFDENCYNGVITDCLNAAKLYEKEKNYAKSIEFLDAACILGDGYSCLKLSHIYLKNLWENVRTIDDKTRHKVSYAYSLRAYEILGIEKVYYAFCKDFELSSGCLYLSNIYGEQGKTEERNKLLQKAHEIASKGCTAGKGEDCFTLGIMYYYGVLLNKDEKKAIEILQKSCDLKIAGACFYLKDIYESGNIIPKDEKKSFEYLKKACEYFEPNACYELWKKKKNKEYLLTACDLGHKQSCSELNTKK